MDKIWKGEGERGRHFKHLLSIRTFVKVEFIACSEDGEAGLTMGADWEGYEATEGLDRLRCFRP